MKRTWFKVLPLALVLAYCSGPNNTQTTQSTDNTSTSTASTTTTDATTVSDETATTNTGTESTTASTGTVSTTSSSNTNTGTKDDYTYEYRGGVVVDTTDPKWAHWQKNNGSSWTYDFDKKSNSDLNLAVNGSWQLMMTPELASLWRNEDRSQVYAGMYPSLDGNSMATRSQLMAGETFISASESFDNTNRNNATNLNANSTTNLNNNSNVANNNIANPSTATGTTSGTGSLNNSSTVTINGSTNAGTVSANNNSATTHAQNNNASANAAAANRANGSVSGSVNTGVSTMNNSGTVNAGISAQPSASAGTNTTINSSVNGNTNTTTGTTATTGVNGSVNGSTSVGTTGTIAGTTTDVNASTNLNATTDASATGTATTMGIESVDYTAANGNYYQMPRFNLFIDNGSFVGYTGCNNISGRIHVTGNTLHFKDTNPQTKIECPAGFTEQALLDMLKKVDGYQYTNDELQLTQGGSIVMRFKRNGQPAATTNSSTPTQQ
jgi:heat shock protein HslJ